MYITAALIGLGVFVLFFDLPKKMQGMALANMWAPHILIFVVLVAIHGGSAEGTVVAGIATLVFRWFLHKLARRRGYEGSQPTQTIRRIAPEPLPADDYSTDDTLYMVIFSITGLLALATFIF